MPRPQGKRGFAWVLALGLTACAAPQNLDPNGMVREASERVSAEALAQAQLPENPTDAQLERLPSAWMQGD